MSGLFWRGGPRGPKVAAGGVYKRDPASMEAGDKLDGQSNKQRPKTPVCFEVSVLVIGGVVAWAPLSHGYVHIGSRMFHFSSWQVSRLIYSFNTM